MKTLSNFCYFTECHWCSNKIVQMAKTDNSGTFPSEIFFILLNQNSAVMRAMVLTILREKES
jgi:hypothetical protein